MLKNIFFIFLFLTFIFPRAGFYFHNAPITIANILLGALILIWIFSRIIKREYPKNIFEWGGIIYSGYVFFCFIRGVICAQTSKAITGLIIMVGYILSFFLTLYFLKTKKDISFATTIIITGMALTTIYGLLQIFLDMDTISIPGLTELYGASQKPVIILRDEGMNVIAGNAISKNIMWGGGMPVESSIEEKLIIGHKVFSTFHHGNIFGAHLVIFIPFLLGITFARAMRYRLPLYISIVLAMIILIFTNSRAAFLGLNTGLILLIVLSPRNWLKVVTMVTVSLLIFILIISMAVLHNFKITGVDPSIYLYYNIEPRYLEFGKKLALFCQSKMKGEVENLNKALELDALANKRFTVREEAFRNVFRNRPIKEILFGNRFYKTDYYKFYNFYLWMIFELGIIGFILYISFLGCIIAIFFYSLIHVRDKKIGYITRGGLAGIIGGIIHNIFDAPFYYIPTLTNFCILAGIIIILVKRDVFS